MDPQNPWFVRANANREWSWFMGRGVVHEPDDFRPDNPPSNPERLAFLEQELTAHQHGLKHIAALILNSKTYQFSSQPGDDRGGSARTFRAVSHAPPREIVCGRRLQWQTGLAGTETGMVQSKR